MEGIGGQHDKLEMEGGQILDDLSNTYIQKTRHY